MRVKRLDAFFSPGSVAVVGASAEPGKLSNIILESLKKTGFPGEVYPVNPKYSSIGELPCYPSISDIGSNKVDLAVFALPAEKTIDVLRQSAGLIKGAIIIGGGFGETSEEGKVLERKIKEFVKETGIRVIGPNCMGIYDTVSRLDTFFIPGDRIERPVKGGLSILSQSGSFAITAMDELAAEGVGVARVISYGNKADVGETDCLEFLVDDEETTAVAIYIESIEDGRRFVEAAARCAAKKPVMAVKVGKAGAGINAARSHTGAIAGRYEIYRAAFRKAGVIELDGYEDFIAACKAFGTRKEALGNRVMIITDGGGMGVGIADACSASGLEVPPLSEGLIEKLAGVFPPYFAISNPIDLTGSATDGMYAEALERTLSEDVYDMAIVAALWGPPALSDGLPALLADRAEFIKKPVLICSPGGRYSRAKAELFRRSGFPVFPTPEAAVRAASVLARANAIRKETV
ncbi:MAG: CoA-binding protein [Deltaproteobacteria bacterium]|nr:CoA-binding protein [Deltaproteobacteria bacterium]